MPASSHGLAARLPRRLPSIAIEQINRRRDDALAALLGNARLSRYDAFRLQQPGLRQVNEFNQLFTASGVPLSAEQSSKLSAMLSEEQAWMAEQAQRLAARTPRRVDASSMAPLMEQAALVVEEANRRKLQRAEHLLGDRQLQLLKDSLDRKLAEVRAQAASARGMPATQGK
jgi:tRNA A37 N6-isopentenylltransferase MiaA